MIFFVRVLQEWGWASTSWHSVLLAIRLLIGVTTGWRSSTICLDKRGSGEIFNPVPSLRTKGSVKHRSHDFDPLQPFCCCLTSLYRQKPYLCREDLRNPNMTSWNTRRFFSQNWAYSLQNVQLLQYFTTNLNTFSLNLTGDSQFSFLRAQMLKAPVTNCDYAWSVVFKVPYRCCCFPARSTQGRIQGGPK